MNRLLLGSVALACSGAAFAQTCDLQSVPIDMIGDAALGVLPLPAAEERAAIAGAAAASAVAAAADLPTGPALAGAATASTIANFLPLFSLAGLSGNVT